MSGEDLIKDVKVGNLVMLMGKVVEVQPSDFVTPTFKAAAKPIVLTPEWFERGGFKKFELNLSKSTIYEKGPVSYNVTLGDWHVGAQRINPINREYVHNLQNLYYEATRNHLTFDIAEDGVERD